MMIDDEGWVSTTRHTSTSPRAVTTDVEPSQEDLTHFDYDDSTRLTPLDNYRQWTVGGNVEVRTTIPLH